MLIKSKIKSNVRHRVISETLLLITQLKLKKKKLIFIYLFIKNYISINKYLILNE
jgi:hypothetical protein